MNLEMAVAIDIDRLNALMPIDLMKFTLTYSGELHAAGNNSPRAKEKWDIRKKLHPQLDELWQTHPVLKGFGLAAEGRVIDDSYLRTGRNPSWRTPPEPRVDVQMRMGRNPRTLSAIKHPIVVDGTGFIPLVRHSLSLACDLDILFLRKEEPGSLVLQGGDIDNRLKTLFDGLRVPSKNEMKITSPEHNPFLCLLEQDSLITGVKVRTDRLLTEPGTNVHIVHLVIEVTVRVLQMNLDNLGFLGE